MREYVTAFTGCNVQQVGFVFHMEQVRVKLWITLAKTCWNVD